MTSLDKFLSGLQVLAEVESSINGKLTVVRDFAWGTYIQVNNLTQSGGVVKTVWQTTLTKLKKERFQPRQVLILGLGGGTVAILAQKRWPQTQIMGVEIDPLMLNMGEKYLGLDRTKVKIKVGDAREFVRKEKNKYDLILVDTYLGDKFPPVFESVAFIKDLKKIITPQGKIIFNRLYYGLKRPEAVKFLKRLEKNFGGVEAFYPEANVMFICERGKPRRR